MDNSWSEDFERTIAAYRAALDVMTPETAPIAWSEIQILLGEAYSQRLLGDRSANIEYAIECFQQALRVITREAMPSEWARAMVLLGTAYSKRIEAGGEETPESRLAPGSVARKAGIEVFVSYAREDSGDAKRLCSDLGAAGFEAWLDEEKLLPGQKWDLEIERAIRASSFFIALLSLKSTSKRGYVQREMKQAMSILDELPEGDVFLIPVRLDNCEPSYLALRRIQRVDLFPVWEIGLARLIRSLNLVSRAELPEGSA